MRWSTVVTILFLGNLLLLITSCRPEQKGNVALSLPSDTTKLSGVADSGMKQDGLDYEPLNTGTFNQLPPELTAVLNKESPGWSLPYISRKVLSQNRRNATGPYFVQADLNQDSIDDFAVQYYLTDTIYVTVYLKQQSGQLKKYPLIKKYFNGKAPTEESKLYLSLLPKGKKLNPDAKPEEDKVSLPQDAIIVESNNITALYYYEGQHFNELHLKHQQGD